MCYESMIPGHLKMGEHQAKCRALLKSAVFSALGRALLQIVQIMQAIKSEPRNLLSTRIPRSSQNAMVESLDDVGRSLEIWA